MTLTALGSPRPVCCLSPLCHGTWTLLLFSQGVSLEVPFISWHAMTAISKRHKTCVETVTMLTRTYDTIMQYHQTPEHVCVFYTIIRASVLAASARAVCLDYNMVSSMYCSSTYCYSTYCILVILPTVYSMLYFFLEEFLMLCASNI